MQRWEYRILHVVTVDRGNLVHSVNGQHLRDLPIVYDYIARLGDEGWELTGVLQGQLYFKRPKG